MKLKLKSKFKNNFLSSVVKMFGGNEG